MAPDSNGGVVPRWKCPSKRKRYPTLKAAARDLLRPASRAYRCPRCNGGYHITTLPLTQQGVPSNERF